MVNCKIIFGLVLVLCSNVIYCCKKGVKEHPAEAIAKPLSIEALVKNPSQYIDSLITVSGILINQGKDYFKDLQVVLKDSIDNTIPVTVWVPIEIPPMQDPSIPRPKVLYDYIDKKVELKGYLRSGKFRPSHDSKYYFEVKEATVVQGK